MDQVEFLPDITIDGEIPTLWYMPILSFSIRRSEDTLSAPQIHGLVIRSTENDAFERVGYFWTSDEDMMMKITGESKEITIIFQ